MSQSTPLDKIEQDVSENNGASDAMRVQRILQEINGGGDEAPGAQEQQTYQPQQQQQQQQQMQPNYPMYQPPNMMPPQPLMGPGMVPYQQEHEQYHHQQQQQQQRMPPPQEEPAPPAPAKKNVWAHITDALKLPVVVAVVFFLLSLPVVDVYLSKYAHWAFSSGGQLSIAGIALKAAVAGSILGVYDTIDSFISRFF